MGSTYGYVRVSTREQNEDRQMIAMGENRVPRKNIFLDKQSGKDFRRPQYQRMVKKPPGKELRGGVGAVENPHKGEEGGCGSA